MTTIGLPKISTGKVRDIYEVGHDCLLMVASDRISAFDVVLDEPIPDKGRVLTGLSTFWFAETNDLVENHLISADPTDFPATAGPDVAGRAMLVRPPEVPMECVVRGYLFGSAYASTRSTGPSTARPCRPAWPRPSSCRSRSSRRPPRPTRAMTWPSPSPRPSPSSARPATKSCATLSIAIYQHGNKRPPAAGILLADTKFEFGEVDGRFS